MNTNENISHMILRVDLSDSGFHLIGEPQTGEVIVSTHSSQLSLLKALYHILFLVSRSQGPVPVTRGFCAMGGTNDD